MNLQFFAEDETATDNVKDEKDGTDAGNENGAGTASIAELLASNAQLKAQNATYKKNIDKLSSESGELRKQLRAKQTAEEQEAQLKAEQDQAVKTELESVKHQLDLLNATKRYMSLGMSEELATTTAKAELDSDMSTVTSTLQTFMSAEKKTVEEQVKAEYLAKMPNPQSGNGNGQIDYAKEYTDKIANGDVNGAILAQLAMARQAKQQ